MELQCVPSNNFKRNAILPDKQHHYKILSNIHRDQVIEMFAHAFCYSEPMTAYLKMDINKFKIFAGSVVDKAISDNLSIVALDNDKVIACALVEDLFQPGEIPDFDPKFKYILALLERLGAHYFDNKQFEKNQIAHLFITAVHESYRHIGLSRQVNFHAMDLAAFKGFQFMYSELTNFLNEKGTIFHLKNNKKLIGKEIYSTFVTDGIKPFASLTGGADSYLWEIREDAVLKYKKENTEVEEVW